MTMPKVVNTPLKSFYASLATIVGIITCLWFLGEGTFNDKVELRTIVYVESPAFEKKTNSIIKEYLKSAEFKILTANIISDYETILKRKDSDKVPLRKLLADEAKITTNRLVIDFADMHGDWKKINKIIRELKRQHPDININID